MKSEGRVVSLSKCPSINDVLAVVRGDTIIIDDDVIRALEGSRKSYLDAVNSGVEVYGYCTGLGELLGKRAEKCGSGWEEHVLHEHAMTVGDPAPKPIVRGFIAVRLTQLARGRAPVRGIVARRLADALNKDFVPVVHIHGSVGASGDLAPSAQVFLCLFYGEGEAYGGGGIVSCRERMRRVGLEPLPLEPGEALALINNTAWSTALGILAYGSLRNLWERSIQALAQTLSVTGCNPQHYSREVLEATMHEGVKQTGRELWRGLEACVRRRLQDPYSLRCSPQVLGAVYEALEFSRRLLEDELCSSTENPIIVDGSVWHWCGFHSIHVALAVDAMKIAASYMGNLLERRISQLLRGEITGLPEFLAGKNDSVGAMIAHYTAASLAARLRWIANPVSVHNTPTSGLQEDIVPMSPEAGYSLIEAVKLLKHLLAIELAISHYARSGFEGGVEGLKRLMSEVDEGLTGDIYF